MPSVSRLLDLMGPAGLIVQALLASLAAVVGLLIFILLRRGARRIYFWRRDRRVLEARADWNAIVDGTIPPKAWVLSRMSREIIEGILLDRLEVAPPKEAQGLLECLRFSGLLDARVHEARTWRGWRRHKALLALGRMQVAEAIPALAEGLDDAEEECRIAATRGLGRLGLPRAAVPILQRLSTGKLQVPSSLLLDALINNCRPTPALALTFLLKSVESAKPLLARVLGEIATPDLDEDLLLLASDESSEVRASAARALACAKPGLAVSILTGLVDDEEWFVRLRAVVALGELEDPRAIPVLLHGLCDRNRQVRIRSACGLSRLKNHLEDIICLALKTQDTYAIQELVSELERSGGIFELVTALGDSRRRARAEAALLAALRWGCRRILLDLVLHHENWRTRGALARLLCRSGDTELLKVMELFDSPGLPLRKRRVLRWLERQLAPTQTSLSQAVRVVA
jgi:HEAT repeat protein